MGNNHPPQRPPVVAALSIVFVVLSVTLLTLRFFTRAHIKRQPLGLDDGFAAVATVLAVPTFILLLVVAQVDHQNRHSWDVSRQQLEQGKKIGLVYTIFWSQAACQAKLSLLAFSRRLVRDAHYAGLFGGHYLVLRFLFVLVALCQVMFLIFSVVQCRPLKAAWDVHPTYPYKCFQIAYFFLIAGVINTATDLCCTLLPASIMLKLPLPLRRRLAAASLFMVGIIANIASALRIYYAYRQFISNDEWNSMPASIASNLELGLGLLCVSAPTIRPFVLHCKSKLFCRIHAGKIDTTVHPRDARTGHPRIFDAVGNNFGPDTDISVLHNLKPTSSRTRSKRGSAIRVSEVDWDHERDGIGGIEVMRTVELVSVRAGRVEAGYDVGDNKDGGGGAWLDDRSTLEDEDEDKSGESWSEGSRKLPSQGQ